MAGFPEPRIAKKIKNKSQACKEFVEFIYIEITYLKNMLKIKKKSGKIYIQNCFVSRGSKVFDSNCWIALCTGKTRLTGIFLLRSVCRRAVNTHPEMEPTPQALVEKV